MPDSLITSQDQEIYRWNDNVGYGSCEFCQGSFILPTIQQELLCPNCFKAKLTISQLASPDLAELRIPVPELLIPVAVNDQNLNRTWEGFFSRYWFRPADLSLSGLRDRLSAVYFPVWLVDAEVQADWQVDAGFNYQVVSYKDRYDQSSGGWRSQEVQETRQRWAPRIGRLQRLYQNITSPAINGHTDLMHRLGSFSMASAESFDLDHAQPELTEVPLFFRLPDRNENESWLDAQPGFERAAAAECLKAIGADHIRSFHWSPEFLNQNWTLIFFPMFVTYYRDDEDNIHRLLLNGQNGRLSGLRIASIKKARKTSLILLLSASALFLVSLLAFAASVLAPVAVLFGFIGLVLAIGMGFGSLIPVVVVWLFNRKRT